MTRVVILLTVLIVSVPCTATITYVDDDALNDPWPGDPNDGDPLEDGTFAHPFDTIQEGIDAAFNGDTVEVLDSTYTGIGNRDIDFGGKAITVSSENGAENCIIDCQGNTSEPHRGFIFQSGENENSVLDGFTIRNGYQPGDWWLSQHSYQDKCGGGISCYNSSPVITNCIIEDNKVAPYGGYDESGLGGGIYSYCDSGGGPTVVGCVIRANEVYGADLYCEGYSGIAYGGGMFCYGGALIIDCIFQQNICHGGWCSMRYGGGIYGGNATITNCTITGNSANSGGGLYNCDGTITNCIIWGNSGGDMAGCSTPSYSCFPGGSSNNVGSDPLTRFLSLAHQEIII